MKTLTAFMSALLMTAFAAVSYAAGNPAVNLEAQDIKIEQAAEEISKQAGVQVICDTDVKGTVSGSFSSIEVEQLLDIITKSNNLKWQKLYIRETPEKKLTVKEIKAQADAVSAIADMPMVVYDPVTKKQTIFVKQSAEETAIAPDKLGLKPIYFISNPVTQTAKKEAVSSENAVSEYYKLMDQQNKALAAMTPEQRIAAYQQEIISQINMDEATRLQLFRDRFQARNNIDPQLRDQYRDMMRDTFRSLREQGHIHFDRGDWGGRDGRRGGDRRGGGQRQ